MKELNRKFIEANFNELNNTIDIIKEGIQKQKWDKYELAGIEGYLIRVYVGYKNIIRTLLENSGIQMPKGEQWHVILLGKAKKEMLIPEKVTESLRGMLQNLYNHANGDSYALDEKEIRNNSLEVLKSHPMFEKHVLKILEKEHAISLAEEESQAQNEKCGVLNGGNIAREDTKKTHMLKPETLAYLQKVAKKYDVQKMILFGSCLYKPEDEAGDIDLAVDMKGTSAGSFFYFGGELLFSKELNKTVDVVDLNDNAPINHIILNEGVVIYDS